MLGKTDTRTSITTQKAKAMYLVGVLCLLWVNFLVGGFDFFTFAVCLEEWGVC